MTIIHSSAPTRPETPSTFVPPSPAVKAALRAYVTKTTQQCLYAGLYPDGRIRDMAAYARHLRNGGQA
jgi:hypothetical protein